MDEKDTPESRMVLRGLLILMAVAGVIILVTALAGRGLVGG